MSKVSRLVKYLSLILGAIVVLFPIYIAWVTAFKTETELGHSLPFALPKSLFNLENFKLVFQKGNVLLGFGNISYIILLTVIGNIVLGTMTAYAIGRFKFRLKPIIMGAYALSMIIPRVTTQVTTFGVVRALGLYNTHYSMVVLGLGVDFIQLNIYLQFLKNIPYELDESAIMDGASLFKIYRSIIVPLMTPAIVTTVILKVVGIYNDIYSPYLYMPSSKLLVISTVLMKFSTGISNDWTVLCAAALVISAPTVILYLILQKYIFAGVVNGAVKG
jgi:multiple sugar transport system permease protein